MPSIEKWNVLCAGLGLQADNLSHTYYELMARYHEPQRHYHTVQHLDECLQHLEAVKIQARYPEEVEYALWFHDAVYESKASDNEARSADWARREALMYGLSADSTNRIHALIMATRHDVPIDNDSSIDRKIILDVDLAILGSSPDRFDEYEHAIRKEYAWVPGFVFRHKRKKLLKGILSRPSIYLTPYFMDRYELQARENIKRSLG